MHKSDIKSKYSYLIFFYIDTRENKLEKKQMATLLFSGIVMDQYKEVSETLNSVDVTAKANKVRKLTMKQMMQESFFHGATRFGDNFIA